MATVERLSSTATAGAMQGSQCEEQQEADRSATAGATAGWRWRLGREHGRTADCDDQVGRIVSVVRIEVVARDGGVQLRTSFSGCHQRYRAACCRAAAERRESALDARSVAGAGAVCQGRAADGRAKREIDPHGDGSGVVGSGLEGEGAVAGSSVGAGDRVQLAHPG